MLDAYLLTRRCNVSFAGLVILDLLRKEGESFSASLARRLRISTAAMCKVICELELLAYIHVDQARADRRKRIITITEDGEKLLNEAGL